MAQLSRADLKAEFDSFKKTNHIQNDFDDLIDSVWNLVDDGSGGGGGAAPYLVYTAIIDNVGDASAPTVLNIFQNTLGAVPVWSRITNGVYRLTSAGKFPEGKVFIIPPATTVIPAIDGQLLPSLNSTNDYVRFDFDDTNGVNIDFAWTAWIEIRVYP